MGFIDDLWNDGKELVGDVQTTISTGGLNYLSSDYGDPMAIINDVTGKTAAEEQAAALEQQRLLALSDKEYALEQYLPYQTWGNQGMAGLTGLGSYSDYASGFNYNETPYAQYLNTQLMNSLAARGMAGQGTAAMKQAELAGQNYLTERDYYNSLYGADYDNYMNMLKVGMGATDGMVGANGTASNALSSIASQQGALDAASSQTLSNLLSLGLTGYGALTTGGASLAVPVATNALTSMYPTTTAPTTTSGIPSYYEWGI